MPDKSRLPSFFLAGAPKAGTTYIADVLGCHPDIFMPVTKEPAFFSRDPEKGHYERGWRFYQKTFHDAGADQRIGEASTLYFHDADSAALIREAIPNARIVIVLRNPVDRVYSNYWQYIKSGFDLPAMDKLVEQGGDPLEHMIGVSHYPGHVRRFLDVFGSDRVLILTYEALSRDPAAVMKRILGFVGVQRPLDPACLGQGRANAAGVPRSRWLARLLRHKRIIQTIKAMVPGALVAPARRWLDRLRWSNTRVQAYPPLSAGARRYLWDRLQPVPEEIEYLTGISLEEWKRDREQTLG